MTTFPIAVAVAERRSRLRRLFVAALAVLVAVAIPIVSPAPADAAADPALVSKLKSVMADPRSKAAKTGATVLDADTGELLYSRYGTRAVMPASNTKILTAAAALETLGPSYRFKTEVIRRAKVLDGVLQGRLYLKGYGDPTLRESDLATLARKTRAAGITRVAGDLVVDASFFDSQTYNPGWRTSYADEYYAAPVMGLTLAPNADYDSGTVIVRFTPGSRGKRAKISTYPAAAARFLRIDNRTVTSARGTSTTFWVDRPYGSDTITVGGRVPQGRSTGSVLVTVSRPDLYAGGVFRAALADAGVVVDGAVIARTIPVSKQRLIARDRSMDLSAMLVPFMKLSNNMHAEALTKTMGRVDGAPGTWPAGLSITTRYLTSLGVPMTGVSLTDGSGLTRLNTVTPIAMATLLYRVRSEPWFADFSYSLPVAGNTSRMVGGTLRYRMNGTAAANNARAKTGSLTGVTALAGYVTGRDGRRYVFSLVSNYSGRSPRPVENTFVIALARWRG